MKKCNLVMLEAYDFTNVSTYLSAKSILDKFCADDCFHLKNQNRQIESYRLNGHLIYPNLIKVFTSTFHINRDG